jgi:hypothetical protein
MQEQSYRRSKDQGVRGKQEPVQARRRRDEDSFAACFRGPRNESQEKVGDLPGTGDRAGVASVRQQLKDKYRAARDAAQDPNSFPSFRTWSRSRSFHS